MEDPRDLPTMGDYAYQAAQATENHVVKVDKEIASLKERVVALENTVGQLLYALDHMKAISDRDRMAH